VTRSPSPTWRDQTLRLLADGKANKEIANALDIGERT
jgi:DNA-binding NarL/FixJ family response regulator